MGTMVVTLMLIITCCSYAAAGGKKVCTRPAEIVFLVDTSRSIHPDDFELQLNFVKSMIDKFDVSPDKTRIAVVSFSNEYQEEFKLDSYDNAEAMKKRVGNISHTQGGTTQTHEAIKYAREDILSKARPGHARMIICVTDGSATDATKTGKEAMAAKRDNILMFGVGVGLRKDDKGLDEISTKVKGKNFIHKVENFNLLSTIKDVLADEACAVAEPPINDPRIATKACEGKPADVVFVLDRSSSVTTEDFTDLLNTVKAIVEVMDIGPDKTQIAAVAFNSETKVEFYLNQFTTKSSVLDNIGKIKKEGKGTLTGKALSMVQETVLSPKHGARKSSVLRVVIVVTDGKSQDKPFTKSAAESLKKEGIKMFAIGVGDAVVRDELEIIASTPYPNFLFEVNAYDALKKIQYLLAEKACHTKN